jgi:type I restriction enzyme S subunit
MSKIVKLGEILKLEYGKSLSDEDRDVNGAYGAYGANGIKSRTNKFLYSKPSIVVGRKGSAGELTLVNEKFWALDVSYYVTHDDNETDLMYLYYVLKTKNLPSFAKGIKPGLNRNEVYELKISLPTINDQKNAVKKLDSVFNEIEKVKELTKSKLNEIESLRYAFLSQFIT